MQTDKIWPRLKYHPVQYEAWTSSKRFSYLPCGRQSGKTELALRRLVRYLPVKKDYPTTYFYSGPTYAQAKRTAWQRLINLIPKEWISSISHSELTIKTVFGSTLFLFGLDKPQRIEGLTRVDGGVIDENSDIKPGTFDLSVLPTLTWSNGWIWFIGVPKRYGVGAVEYRERCEKAAAGELADSALFHWPSSEIISPEALEYARSAMDERDFAEQFGAKWLDAGGGVFHSFSTEFNVRPCVYDVNLPIIVGMDFNVDPMCFIIGHLKGETFEVFDELFIRNTNTPDTLHKLIEKYGTHKGGFQIYGDASSRARKTSAYESDYIQIASNETLKKLGRTMHFDTSNPPIADRFASTNARICNGSGQRNVFVDPKCKHLINDLRVRTYKPGTREPDDSGDVGHMTDALGYFLHKRFELTLKLPSSNTVGIIYS